MRENKLLSNDIGIFFCWGIRHGLAERNVVDESKSCGISIGHHDTDNLIVDNQITGFAEAIKDLRAS